MDFNWKEVEEAAERYKAEGAVKFPDGFYKVKVLSAIDMQSKKQKEIEAQMIPPVEMVMDMVAITALEVCFVGVDGKVTTKVMEKKGKSGEVFGLYWISLNPRSDAQAYFTKNNLKALVPSRYSSLLEAGGGSISALDFVGATSTAIIMNETSPCGRYKNARVCEFVIDGEDPAAALARNVKKSKPAPIANEELKSSSASESLNDEIPF